MKRLLRLVLIVPPLLLLLLLLLLALFAGSTSKTEVYLEAVAECLRQNRQSVTLSLWPTDYAMTMPLALALIVRGTAGLAFLVGGLLVWFRVRRQSRAADENIRLLEEQIRALRAQPPSNPALPPPTA